MSDGMKRVQSRKWQITINNPREHGFDHDRIREALFAFKGMIYWCMCDEQGDECETLHTHIYFVLRSPTNADVVSSRFPGFHRDTCHGTSSENRAYILKDGEKFNKREDGSYEYVDGSGKRHEGINFSDTFEEWGDLPSEHQGKSNDCVKMLELVKDGASDLEIIEAVPKAMLTIDKVERTRSLFRDAQFADSWRDLEVTYIYGATGSGKTRSVMDKYSYGNCYRVTDYKHPFDTYDGQDVLILEEYRSQFKIADILNYLDGYPLLLPCRYFNRQACFTKVFIISNVPLEDQYVTVHPESRAAFLRRITSVVVYAQDGKQTVYASVQAYQTRYDWVKECEENDRVQISGSRW